MSCCTLASFLVTPHSTALRLGVVGFLAVLLVVAIVTGSRRKIDDWERAKFEAWDREQEQARTRSSAELHEELERGERGAGS